MNCKKKKINESCGSTLNNKYIKYGYYIRGGLGNNSAREFWLDRPILIF